MGSYLLLFELGQGGMASVFAARALGGPFAGEQVACKVLLPHLRKDERWQAQFAAEGRTTSCIRHPNVVRVLEVPPNPHAGYFITELCDGLPLDKLLQNNPGPLPLDVACAVVSDLAAGLHAAHTARSDKGEILNIVHRDVSPHNVLVGFDGSVKLVDFGIAAMQGNARLTRTGELKGKLAYLAPEQITRSQAVDARSDIWALGALAYEILTGSCLFAASDEATTLWNVIAMDVPFVADLRPDVGHELSQVIADCLQRDPTKRPKNAELISHVFRAHAGATPGTALQALMQKHAGPPATPAVGQMRPRRFLWAGLAVVVATALGLVGFFELREPSAKLTTVITPPEPESYAVSATPTRLESSPPKATLAAKRFSKPKTATTPGTTEKQKQPDLVGNPYTDLVSNPY